MTNYFNYRLALCLALILATIDFAFFIYVSFYIPSQRGSMALHVAIAMTIAFGLWVQSKIARYLGAVLLLIFAASAIWLPFSDHKIVWNIVLAWTFSMGALSLIIAGILLFSKTFANEFADERKKQAGYKKVLRNAFAILLLIAAAAATLNDIYNLFLAS
jgi:hypothetical protein